MSALAAWGRFVHRRRVLVLAFSVLLLAASIGVLAQGGRLVSYQVPANTQSGEATTLIERQIPGASEASFFLVLSHPTLRAGDAAFQAATQAALLPLQYDKRVTSVLTPFGAPASVASAMTSKDAHKVLVIVNLKDDAATARDYFPELRAKVRSDTLQVTATGAIAVYSNINTILEGDLQKAEAVSLPLSLLLLLAVFGTVVAALLPIGVGGLAVLGGVAGVLLASRFTDVFVYAMNIVTLIGLGVAIDYSLFLVNRYREELRNGRVGEDALAETLKTAGRATLFSGLTVAIGLLGLSFYRGLYFTSMGMAGAIVVALAVLYSLTFLPALLAVLGSRVNKLRVPYFGRDRVTSTGFWARLAHAVMARPLRVLVPVLVLLVVAGLPFAQISLAGAGVKQLPESAEARQGFELLKSDFPAQGTSTITVVVDFGQGASPLSSDHVGSLYDASRAIAAIPHVTSVQSVVDVDPSFSREQYQQLYAQPKEQRPAAVQELERTTVGARIVVLRAVTDVEETTQEARHIVDAIRALPPPAPGGRILATGPAAYDIDTIALIQKDTPIAFAFIFVTTYILLLVQTGSVLLPLKAILMNMLSIAASFGALVWIFQQGHLSGLLAFTPAPVDPSTPVLLFCIVFGLSMDYEVLLLSRMHEEYERTHDNQQAVAAGLQKSGRLITSAAGIMVLVFAAFALAQVTIIKAIGLGLAIAIAIDATLVRALVVPATMRLLGDRNWWAPAWVHRLWKAVG